MERSGSYNDWSILCDFCWKAFYVPIIIEAFFYFELASYMKNIFSLGWLNIYLLTRVNVKSTK